MKNNKHAVIAGGALTCAALVFLGLCYKNIIFSSFKKISSSGYGTISALFHRTSKRNPGETTALADKNAAIKTFLRMSSSDDKDKKSEKEKIKKTQERPQTQIASQQVLIQKIHQDISNNQRILNAITKINRLNHLNQQIERQSRLSGKR